MIALRDSMAAIDEKAQHEPHDSCSRMGFIVFGTKRQSTSLPSHGVALILTVFWSFSEDSVVVSSPVLLRINFWSFSGTEFFDNYKSLNSSYEYIEFYPISRRRLLLLLLF